MQYNYVFYAPALKFLRAPCPNVLLTLMYGCNLTLKLNHARQRHFASSQAGLNNRPLAETGMGEDQALFISLSAWDQARQAQVSEAELEFELAISFSMNLSNGHNRVHQQLLP